MANDNIFAITGYLSFPRLAKAERPMNDSTAAPRFGATIIAPTEANLPRFKQLIGYCVEQFAGKPSSHNISKAEDWAYFPENAGNPADFTIISANARAADDKKPFPALFTRKPNGELVKCEWNADTIATNFTAGKAGALLVAPYKNKYGIFLALRGVVLAEGAVGISIATAAPIATSLAASAIDGVNFPAAAAVGAEAKKAIANDADTGADADADDCPF